MGTSDENTWLENVVNSENYEHLSTVLTIINSRKDLYQRLMRKLLNDINTVNEKDLLFKDWKVEERGNSIYFTSPKRYINMGICCNNWEDFQDWYFWIQSSDSSDNMFMNRIMDDLKNVNKELKYDYRSKYVWYWAEDKYRAINPIDLWKSDLFAKYIIENLKNIRDELLDEEYKL